MKINIAGQDYPIPAMDLKTLRDRGMAILKEQDELAKKEFNEVWTELLLKRAEFVTLALTSKYKELAQSEEVILAALDMRNITPLWQVALGNSGFVAPKDDAGQSDQGEQSPAATLTT